LHFLFAVYLLSKELLTPMADAIDPKVLAATESIANANEQMKKTTEEIGKVSDAFSKLSSSNVDIIKSFAGLGKQTTNVVDQIGNLAKAIGEVATKSGVANMLNLAADKLLANSQELANTLEKSRGAYVAATGDVLNYTDSMTKSMHEASNNITKFGADVSAAAIGVRSALPMMTEQFNNVSQATKDNFTQITTNVALMKELGMGVDQTTATISSYSDSLLLNNGIMGDFTTRAAMASENVAKTTLVISDMGYTLSEASSIMSQASDVTLVFGEKALKELAAVAKTTRIAVADLLAVSSNFDTFEKAGEQVGKFNALLGADYLGTTEMMFAAPAEQVKMISGAFEQAGLTASSLSNMSDAEQKFTLMTIQSTLGLKNKGDALKFLQANEFERADLLQKQAEQEEKNANTQERLNELLIQSMPAIEQLANTFKNFFSILEPGFTALNFMMNKLNELFTDIIGPMKQWSDAAKIVVGVIELLVLAIGGFLLGAPVAVIAMGSIATSMTALGAGQAVVASTAAPAATGITGVGTAAAASAGQIAAIGVAALGIGAGIGLAAYGLSLLVASFKDIGDAAPYAALGVGLFTYSFVALMAVLIALVAGPQAVATAAAVGVLNSVGLAALMIGAGIGLAAAGIGYFVSSIAKLADVGDAVSSIQTLAVALETLTGKTIKIDVQTTGDIEALKAAAKLTTTAANAPTTSAITPTATNLSERQIVIKEVNIRFDKMTSFRGYVEEIIYEGDFDKKVKAAIYQ
jgi:hypothetical protein